MLPPDTDAPASWPVPQLPSGGPEAAREVAATCERLAVVLRSTAATVAATRQLCASTTGQTGTEIAHKLDELKAKHEITAGNLERSSQAMRRLADELEAAQHRHHSALKKMLMLGATVAIGAGVMWVTAGSAAPVVATALGAEAAAAEAAAAAAAAAAESAAAECSALARAFASVRGLASVSRTQIVYAEAWVTTQSVRSQIMDDRLWPSTSAADLAMDAAGIFVGGGAGKLAGLALAGRAGTAVTTVVTTGASAAGGAVPQTAYDWYRTGSFRASSFAWDAVQGAGSSVISDSGKKLVTTFDKWKAVHHPRPQPGQHRSGRHRPAGS
jgi:hypothetical protein